jgi:hypothetical protein
VSKRCIDYLNNNSFWFFILEFGTIHPIPTMQRQTRTLLHFFSFSFQIYRNMLSLTFFYILSAFNRWYFSFNFSVLLLYLITNKLLVRQHMSVLFIKIAYKMTFYFKLLAIAWNYKMRPSEENRFVAYSLYFNFFIWKTTDTKKPKKKTHHKQC